MTFHFCGNESHLWAELKRRKIDALRQASVKVTHKQYFLDFALYCDRGKIDVETDGDFWHSNKHRIAEDNQRDNDLATQDWLTLRFNSRQVLEEMNDYCIPTIVATISGKISVETDGDFWHSKKHRIAEDNQRDNDLATQDWLTLRFNSRQVLEEMNDYCIPTIVATIKRLGGLKELGKLMPRQIQSDDCVWEQLTLF
ncbi:endonuclease domain-containing protein [Phormidium sp. CCY1219]|nr:endonuclease domain-containing protein [Phormidium sp. CCY1219]